MRACPFSRKCSGCQLQNLTYPEQLKMKQVKLIRLLGRFCHVDEIIGMEDPTNYRNKAQAMFAYKSGRIISGIYQSTLGKLAEVDSCMLETETSQKIVKTVKNFIDFMKSFGIPCDFSGQKQTVLFYIGELL